MTVVIPVEHSGTAELSTPTCDRFLLCHPRTLRWIPNNLLRWGGKSSAQAALKASGLATANLQSLNVIPESPLDRTNIFEYTRII